MGTMNLRQLAGGADRLVVFDTETTGVYPSDRIIEIGLVTLSLDGEVLDRYETLINPGRDVAATHVHGITASMVRDAPHFSDIAGDLGVRLHGACLVAHNLPFDLRMLGSEFERLEIEFDVGVGIDTLRATRQRLAMACEEYDVNLDDAHSALADALATAQLFIAVAELCEPGAPARVTGQFVRGTGVRRRHDSGRVKLPDPPLVSYLASRLPHAGVDAAALAYLEVVGRAVADMHVTADERRYLEDFAKSVGLDAAHVAQSHRRFVNELIDAAVADEEVTDSEYDMLLRVAGALGVDLEHVETRLAGYRSSAGEVVLNLGMRLVFTGEHAALDREELRSHAVALGLEVQSGVSRTTELLAAADVGSQSGKAAKARRYGVPIVSVDDLASARIGDRLPAVGVVGGSLRLVSCPDCFATWTEDAMSLGHSRRRCSECQTLPPSVPSDGDHSSTGSVERLHSDARSSTAATEELTCSSCGIQWFRVITRGRKPFECPECRAM
jgi:DNA polymerase-3 subunit epsilon